MLGKMKKILFVVIHAGLGGIEKSFVNLVHELVKTERYQIDIFMFTQKGELLQDIPSQCYMFPENKYMRMIGITQEEAWKDGEFYGMTRLMLGGITKYISRSMGYALTMSSVERLSGYDVAISYMHGKTNSFYGGTNEFVLKKVDANKKFSFIHGDLINANLNIPYNHRIYKKFDKIANVSSSCKELFDIIWRDLADKSVVVENGCDVQLIRAMAGDGKKYDTNFCNIVTVARIDSVKGIPRAIEAFSKVKDEGVRFRWHIIGGGDLRCVEEVRELLGAKHLEEDIIMYGPKDNPYWYIKNADAFLLPSYQEAAPVVYQEANSLGVPILTTRTLSAVEMVEKPRIGIVCENTENGLYNMLKAALENSDILGNIRCSMRCKQDNNKMLAQFQELIGED